MIITNFDDLECTLPQLDDVKFNPKKRYGYCLKSSANHEDVKHYAENLFTRLFAYQVLNFYEFIPELPAGSVTVFHECNTNVDNQVNETKENVNRYVVNVKTTLENPYSEQNNGNESVNVDWYGAVVFPSTFALNRCAYINTEDLRFNKEEANFLGRSMMSLFLKQYATDHSTQFHRSFEILPAEDETYTDGFRKVIEMQRDLSLENKEQIEFLGKLKCRRTGADGTALLDKDWKLTK